MELSDISVRVIENRPHLKGSASIVIDGAIKIRKLSIVMGKNDELFVSWPSERLRNGNFLGIAYPISNEVRLEISKHILAEYERIKASESKEDSINI